MVGFGMLPRLVKAGCARSKPVSITPTFTPFAHADK